MSLLDTPAPPIGHNNPPADSKREEIDTRVDAFLAGADVWSQRPEFDADLAARANDFITGAKKLITEAEAARRAEKIPHEKTLKAIDAAWEGVKSKLEKIVATVRPKLDAYARRLQAQQAAERAAREEAAREVERQAEIARLEAESAASESQRIEAETRAEALAKEATAAAKDAKAVGPARIASATGAGHSRGFKTVRRARIASLGLALAHYRDEPKLADLVLQLAAAELRDAPTIKGVKQVPSIPGIVFDESQELNA